MVKKAIVAAKQIKTKTSNVRNWQKPNIPNVDADVPHGGNKTKPKRQIVRRKVTKKKKTAKDDVNQDGETLEAVSEESTYSEQLSSATSSVSSEKSYASVRSNRYPGLLDRPEVMSVIGSECGNYNSLRKLMLTGFRLADRVYIMVSWGNYVVFRCTFEGNEMFYVFDGCACDINRFRYMNLMDGTAGLIYFTTLDDVVNYIITSRAIHFKYKSLLRKENQENLKRKKCTQNSSKRITSSNKNARWRI